MRLILYLRGVNESHFTEKVLSGQRLRRMSKNGILLSSSNSRVNLMLSCRLFRKLKNSLALSLLSNMVKMSSTYLNQSEGQNLLFINHFSSKWYMKILAKTGPKGGPMATRI